MQEAGQNCEKENILCAQLLEEIMIKDITSFIKTFNQMIFSAFSDLNHSKKWPV